jgi:hypothetical protein
MKGTTLVLGLSLLLCTASHAGWNWNKEAYESAKSGVEQRVTQPSYCYDAGFEFSGFVTGLWPEDSRLEETIGGGIAIAYFFGHNFGVEGSYSVTGSGTAGGSDNQVATFNAVYRLPLGGECCSTIAPYFFGGPGMISSGSSEMLWNVGVGLDIRFESWGCIGLFGDASYNWVDQGQPDFTLMRAGFRVPF